MLWLPDSKAVDVVRESWLQNAKAGAVNRGLTTFGSSPEGCQGAKGAYSYCVSTKYGGVRQKWLLAHNSAGAFALQTP